MWLLVQGPAAIAQVDPPDAARLYDEGRRYFNIGEYDRAIEKLKAAYLVAPLPELLYDLGQAFRLKGDCAEALSFYRRYLKTAPPAARAERTNARIADMQACVMAATSAPPVPPSTAATASPLELQATPGLLTAVQSSPAPAPASPPPSTARRRWGVWTAVAAGALAAASGYYVWDGRQAGNEVSAAFVPGGMWTDDHDAAQRRGRFDDRMALGAGAAAVVAAGVAAWLLWK